MSVRGFGADGTWIVDDADPEKYGCHIYREINGNNECFDACLLWELESLWAQGIKTECHCCGHGNEAPGIGVAGEENIRRMRAMGYEEAPKGCVSQCDCWVSVWFRAKSKLICERGAKYNV